VAAGILACGLRRLCPAWGGWAECGGHYQKGFVCATRKIFAGIRVRRVGPEGSGVHSARAGPAAHELHGRCSVRTV